VTDSLILEFETINLLPARRYLFLLLVVKLHELICNEVTDYKYGTCQKAFPQVGNLHKHELTYTGVKDYKFGTCSKSFSHKHNLKTH